MKNVILICISVIVFLISCSNKNNQRDKERGPSNVSIDTLVAENAKGRSLKIRSEIINIDHIPDTTGLWFEEIKESSKKENMMPDFLIDTVSLEHFWRDFQNNIRNNNIDKVIEVLEFPVHAIFFVTFKFSYDCDTLKFSKDEDYYADFDIDSSNVIEYYDFMFCKILKKIILQTSTEDLLKDGIRYKRTSGLTYMFFSKNYMRVECPNDHNLKFYISHEPEGWRIGIGGL